MTDKNEIDVRITTAEKDRLNAIELQSAAMAGFSGDASALTWATKAAFFFEEAIREYQAGEIADGDRFYRWGGRDFSKASKSLGR